jgi:hypothetical protein
VRPFRSSYDPLVMLVSVLALALVFAAGCGDNEEKTSGAEGDFVKVGDAVYQVQLSRLLNPEQRPDDDYLRGQPPLQSKENYLATFLTIENEGDSDYSPPRDMKVVDTQGNEYLPVGTPQSSFGLDFGRPLAPDETAPPPDSPAASGPDNGALVLFHVKSESATDNLPLYLEIPISGGKASRIRLDI